jgi:hypothetical protein
MKRIAMKGEPARAALRLGLVVGFLAAPGCADSSAGDKSEDPALKASMQKSLEIYKSKSQARSKQGSSAPTIKRPP